MEKSGTFLGWFFTPSGGSKMAFIFIKKEPQGLPIFLGNNN